MNGLLKLLCVFMLACMSDAMWIASASGDDKVPNSTSQGSKSSSRSSISSEPHAPPTMDEIADRVRKGLKLIESSSAESLKQRECFSCHHQAMSILSLTAADRRGFVIDRENYLAQIQRTMEHLQRGKDQYLQGQGQGGKVDTAGYALLALAASRTHSNETTAAVVEYLLQSGKRQGYWDCSSNRPPTESTDITTTAVAIHGLQSYSSDIVRERSHAQLKSTKSWLEKFKPRDNEERVFALLSAVQLDQRDIVDGMVNHIADTQREDGGWSQTDDMTSDAYATATALVALRCAGIDPGAKVYQSGLAFLTHSQLPDGSWHVVTRSKPIQKYFESGYPHGEDQFLSITAACWSIIAMLEALPEPTFNESEYRSLTEASTNQLAASEMNSDKSKGSENNHSAESIEFFERHVRPVLIEHCQRCHGPDKQESSLRTDSLSALLAGGDTGPAVVPGSIDKSLLIRAVRRGDDLKMPPDKPLNDKQIADLETWVRNGAAWPSEKIPTPESRSDQAKKHWAFQPLTSPSVPNVSTETQSPIDAFIVSKLAANDLKLNHAQTQRDWLTRLSFDLIGLPPTAEQLDAFAADQRPDARERQVNRLLASPRFGEHWGRMWLDVARYADTKGYVYSREERFFVHAAPYRDWVIDAFNNDMPYDRFVLLQLAADQVVSEHSPDLAAMGFLTIGRRFIGVTHDIIDDRIDVVSRGLLGLTIGCARCHDHKYDPIPTADYYSLYGVFQNSVERRERLQGSRYIDADSSSQAFEEELKVRQEKYKSSMLAERQKGEERVRERVKDYLLAQLNVDSFPAEGFDIIIGADDLVPAQVRRMQSYLIAAAERNDRLFAIWRMYSQIPADQFEAIAEAKKVEWKDSSFNQLIAARFETAPRSMEEVVERYASVFQEVVKSGPAKSDATAEGSGSSAQELSRDRQEIEQFLWGPGAACSIPDEDIVTNELFFETKVCESLWKLQGEIDRWLLKSPADVAVATILRDGSPLRDAHILRRGNPKNIGPLVTRHAPSVLHQAQLTANDDPSKHPFQNGSGRLELARWIIDPQNPLASRVWVNRIWSALMGRGIVNTTSDFGLRASDPSHPELLDWLAQELVAHQYSSQQLVRTIVLSDVYQQDSLVKDPAQEQRSQQLDPDNALLWHSAAKRLKWEQQRDAWLARANALELKSGGRAEPMFGVEQTNYRRTIYGLVDRQFLPGVLRVFDFANPDMHAPSRSETTVPQQALFAWNHPFSADVAKRIVEALHSANPDWNFNISSDADSAAAAADRTDQSKTAVPDRAVIALFRQVLARDPNPVELEQSRLFVEQAILKRPMQRSEPKAWSYGYAKIDADRKTLKAYRALPHYTGSAWQGGVKWPDKSLGWAQLTASGGHAGNDRDHAVVRRWTAPTNGVVEIQSKIHHAHTTGDGIQWTVFVKNESLRSEPLQNSQTQWNADSIRVATGETVEFVVDYRDNLNSDDFQWDIDLKFRADDDKTLNYSASKDFTGPVARYLNPWEQLAQVLMLSNELTFVD